MAKALFFYFHSALKPSDRKPATKKGKRSSITELHKGQKGAGRKIYFKFRLLRRAGIERTSPHSCENFSQTYNYKRFNNERLALDGRSIKTHSLGITKAYRPSMMYSSILDGKADSTTGHWNKFQRGFDKHYISLNISLIKLHN